MMWKIYYHALISISVIVFLQFLGTSAISVEVSTNDVDFGLHDHGNFDVFLSSPSKVPISVGFHYTDGRNIVPLPDGRIIKSGDHLHYKVFAHKAGHTTVLVNVTPPVADTSDAFVRVGVFNIAWLKTVSTVVGWLYFICWSVSFYPQIFDNWRRKSVVGLNFDFLALNITGFIAYSVFSVGLRFMQEVKVEYHSLHPTGVIPVEINDVVFAVHAVFATALTIGQCFCYERGDQVVSKYTASALTVAWSGAAIFLLITSVGLNKTTPWLTFLYFCSYVKLAVTLTKYIPQVWYNYKRKSTKGWSIGTVLTDFIGGLFSIMQMFIIAYNYDDWSSIFGNFTKFGLGVASVSFDVIFMVQHYCLYRFADSASVEAALLA